MAKTKEIININPTYEDYDTAWPANNNRVISKEAEQRIRAFRNRKLGKISLAAFNQTKLAA
ncbi:hypothetical protein IJ117_00155 [Candidatus Saccharibacteria bacterium]|nr:hypothetical protein [Candidatus Saccharibacteria bacterium]